jgi:hypothetical protein
MAMKKRLLRAVVLFVVVFLAGPCLALPTGPAVGLQVLSTEFHVYASFVGYGWYDYRSSSPLNETLRLDIGVSDYDDPFIYTGASSSEEWNYRLWTSAGGQRGFIGYNVYPNDPILGPEGWGGAEATMTFRPVGNVLVLGEYGRSTDLGYYIPEGVSLEDISAGVPLPLGEGELMEYSVDPSHVYRARVWAETHPSPLYSFMVSWAVMDSFIVPVVPAPGAIVLGALGAGLIGLLRRRKMI